MTRWSAALRAILLLAAAATAAGCVTHSDYMLDAPAGIALAPEPGKALVVFVRPSRFGGTIKFTLLDESGRMIGDMQARAHFGVQIDPGEHFFVVWAENTDAVQATLAAGRTYYVEVESKAGWWSPRSGLRALRPGGENWGELEAWIRETDRLVPDASALSRLRAEKGEAAVTDRLRLGRARFDEHRADPEELRAHTILPDDGVQATASP